MKQIASTSEKYDTVPSQFQLSMLRDSVVNQSSFQKRFEVNLVGESSLLHKSLHYGRNGMKDHGRIIEGGRLGSASMDGLDTINKSPRFLERLRTPSYPAPVVSFSIHAIQECPA